MVEAEAELGARWTGARAPERHRAHRPGHGRGRQEAQADAVAAQLAGVVEAALGQIEPAAATEPRRTGSSPPSGSLGRHVRHHRRHRRARRAAPDPRRLERLEYRGYDSAGVAIVVDGEMWRARAAGGTDSVAKLAELTADAPAGPRGRDRPHPLGDPRQPDRRRTPTLTPTARAASALVHNGIIENHAELQAELEARRPRMTSATDTEVVAHLIEEHMTAGASLWPRRPVPRSTRCAARSPSPSCPPTSPTRSSPPGARRRSVLGLHDGTALLASDIPALLGHTRHSSHWPTTRSPSSARAPRGDDARRRRRSSPSAHRRLGPRGRAEGRLRGLHVQGDARAAPGRGRHLARPARARRRAILDECALGPDELRGIDKVVHRGLRLELPRRAGGRSTPSSTGRSSRPRSTSRASSATATRCSNERTLVHRRVASPARRSTRSRPCARRAARGQGARHLQRGRLVHGARGRRRALHPGRARDRRRVDEEPPGPDRRARDPRPLPGRDRAAPSASRSTSCSTPWRRCPACRRRARRGRTTSTTWRRS